MKKLRMLLVSVIIVVSTISALELEDYVKGVVDQDGNNLWHILAQGCDKPYFNAYIDQLTAIEATIEDEYILSFLASERNNNNQSALEIAAENWAKYENSHCGDMIKMISAWKKMELTGRRNKKLHPFTMFLEKKEEDSAKNQQ